MPGINDAPEQIEPLLEAAAQAGASFVNGIALHLRKGVREVFMDWLRAARPELVPRYEALYARGAYAPKGERERIASLIRRAGTNPRWLRPASRRGAPPRPVQETLF
jgi:DNA repair photolyase